MTFSVSVATAADCSVATAAALDMHFPSRGARLSFVKCLLLGAVCCEERAECSALPVRLARRRGPCTSLGLSSTPDREHSRCTSIPELQRQLPTIAFANQNKFRAEFASSILMRQHASLIHTE